MIEAPVVTSYLSEHYADEAYTTLAGYRSKGGYQGLEKALAMEPAAVRETVKGSGLRGRGGAGFVAGVKWGFMPEQTDSMKLIVCNGDESEPGSFKDRLIMERAPHQVLEGILIGAWAMGAERSYIYVRGEYALPAERLERAIQELRDQGRLGRDCFGKSGFSHDIIVHRGAGAYICGEETGLLESLEGKKGQPRKKPPFPAQYGAFGLPTTVNNVETFAHVPFILERGTDWFRGFGTETVGTDAGQGSHYTPPYPAHFYLHGAGRYGLQCLNNLDRLPPTGAMLIATPLKIKNGTGSPLRVVALVPGRT